MSLETWILGAAKAIHAEDVRRHGEDIYPLTHYENRVVKLRPLAMRLARYAVEECNRELTLREKRRVRETEARVVRLAHEMGMRVEWGDPRGAPVQFPCAPKHSNYASGEHIAIPWLSAKEYR